ncbi:MAG: tRNA glutamyl-Q(34) synthetase GluQRS [Betaproteobacteria bacterium]|nr:tRNA glutamyl-Q(34) synthetase GluQRS [Betaproteobacteria bacterium]
MPEDWIAAWKQRHAARIAAWRAGGQPYVGRFAPSPTGPLHQGSLVAALASYLDARAHDGRWLIRMEDLDPPREMPGAAQAILETLAACGFEPEGEVVWQSRRNEAYQAAFDGLVARGLVYPCACTRKEVADSLLNQRERAFGRELVYPGTCRQGLAPGRQARAWRLRVPDDEVVVFDDVLQGPQRQDLVREVGDFVIKRADGPWAYQLAVVVDDGAAGVSHVVRGADLLDSTPRQILLQRLLGLPTPVYAHVDVLTNAQGEKLSKQTGAPAVGAADAPAALAQAAQILLGRGG